MAICDWCTRRSRGDWNFVLTQTVRTQTTFSDQSGIPSWWCDRCSCNLWTVPASLADLNRERKESSRAMTNGSEQPRVRSRSSCSQRTSHCGHAVCVRALVKRPSADICGVLWHFRQAVACSSEVHQSIFPQPATVEPAIGLRPWPIHL